MYNNVYGTHNVPYSITESGLDVHLGTIGAYGYGTVDLPIPEGYLSVKVDVSPTRQNELEIPCPAHPTSVCHTTKSLDAFFFYFYNHNDDLRITDPHQGIVWGTQTPETEKHLDLINRFDYDSDYGTVLNSFLMQTLAGHSLMIYGNGGQTRAFIHVRDTLRCIQLANKSPLNGKNRVVIFNQAAETHIFLELAEMMAALTDAELRLYANPRKEQPRNAIKVRNRKLLDPGLRLATLDDGLLREIVGIASAYKERCDLRASRGKW